MITPFKEDLSLDEEGLKVLVDRQVAAGVTGIAPLGVTGENTLMTDDEVYKVVEIIVENAKGKCLVVPDTCEENYIRAKERVLKFADLGADYVSVFAPYFILPKADGIIKFYSDLADVSPVPIVLHNAKGRTGIELTPQITATLAKHPNIAGIKDGNKQLDHLALVMYLTQNEDFNVYTGKDTTAFPFVAFGGSGSFTVAGNVVPDMMKEMVMLAVDGKMEEARELHYKYYELYDALRFETNPMAAKRALNMMGLPAGSLRPPLTELSDAKTEQLKSILTKNGIL